MFSREVVHVVMCIVHFICVLWKQGREHDIYLGEGLCPCDRAEKSVFIRKAAGTSKRSKYSNNGLLHFIGKKSQLIGKRLNLECQSPMIRLLKERWAVCGSLFGIFSAEKIYNEKTVGGLCRRIPG